MRPEKRLNVLGILTLGFTSMSTLREVRIYTWSRPALLSGESRSVNRHCSHQYWSANDGG
jgi:hypothetical protein